MEGLNSDLFQARIIYKIIKQFYDFMNGARTVGTQSDLVNYIMVNAARFIHTGHHCVACKEHYGGRKLGPLSN